MQPVSLFGLNGLRMPAVINPILHLKSIGGYLGTMNAFLNRVKFALQGWLSFFRREKNGQIQLFISVMVIVAGFALKVSVTEWMILLGCIGVVVSLEMVNSALEKICDHVNPQIHPAIKVIKDIAAGAVLWSALISAIIGCLVFIPKLLHLVL
jgi:diacylglycerol kinase